MLEPTTRGDFAEPIWPLERTLPSAVLSAQLDLTININFFFTSHDQSDTSIINDVIKKADAKSWSR